MTPPAGQRWTRRKPTEPGWYWWRESSEYGPHMTEIAQGTIGMTASQDGLRRFVMHIDGEWQGPLTPNEATE